MSANAVVIGGGAVGLAFAAAAKDLEVTVLEGAPAPPAADPPEYDLRVFALSPGTKAFLSAIGAWQRLPADRLAPVRRMQVRGASAGEGLDFDAPAGRELAWIVEGNRLRRALAEAAQARGAHIVHGNRPVSLEATADGANVGLHGGSTLFADLAIGSDGADSWTRGRLRLASTLKRYPETAVVAHFRCEKPTGGIARQWFRHDGILAWLPLPGDRMSIVWSARGGLAEELAALDGDSLARRVRDAGGAALGDLAPDSASAAFPLRLIRVPRIAVPGAVLVGDAAHGVHPLAGQGVNLGFQDAACLAATLAARSPLERPGDLAVLRRHERARRADTDAMQWLTDRLEWLFGLESPAVERLREAGLAGVGRLPLARRLLAAHAMR